MPTCPLPNNPSLEQLRNLAKTLQRLAREGDPGALDFLREFHPRFSGSQASDAELARATRADMQLALARSYHMPGDPGVGFPSWRKLRDHIERANRLTRNPHHQPVRQKITGDDALVDEFLRLACLTYGTDDPAGIERARGLLAEQPELATATIHTAAAVGDVEAAREILAANPSEARREGGPHGWEPLLYLAYSRIDSTAAGHSTLEVARLLLDAGADPNAGYLWEGTCAFTALTGVFGGGEGGQRTQPPHEYEMELARLLLEAGADPNDDQTLYNRLWSHDDRHLELLLEHGLGQGTRVVWWRRLGLDHPTPQELVEEQLRFAAADGRTGRARLLADRLENVDGLGMKHPVLEGRRAVELAALNGNREIVGVLEGAGAAPPRLTPVDEMQGACLAADREAVEEILAREPGALGELIEGRPGLVGTAAELDRPDAIRLMAELGFDVNPRGVLSPLHTAAWNGRLDAARTLVDLGADANRRDRDHSSTPLGWAEYSGQSEVAAYLATVTDTASSS